MMYQKSSSKNVLLAIIVFIMIHNRSVARMERNTNLKKFLKYDDKKMFWLKQKRTIGYRDPCETEENVVNTSSLDSCSTCTYYPSTLKEVKCITNNMPNVRGKTSCKYSMAGDCLDVQATIEVWKEYSNGQILPHDVVLNVGCACHLLPA